MFQRPRLLALGVFPGLFTFCTTTGLIFFLWKKWLLHHSLWLVIPSLFFAFITLWLSIGKLSLIPVEDALVDETQRALWGNVRLAAPKQTINRILREALFSLLIAGLAIVIALLALIPLLTPFEILLAAWITAYSFLSPIFSRRSLGLRERSILFFKMK